MERNNTLMRPWTQEQYNERDRILRESDAPRIGDRTGLGYVGSREHIADEFAASLYERRKAQEPLVLEIVDDMLSRPPNTYDPLMDCIKFLVDYRNDYTHLSQSGVDDWINDALDLIRRLDRQD